MTVENDFKNLQGRFDADPQVQHHFSDGVYAKQMHLPAGFTAYAHKHSYAHLSLLAQGKVIVETDNGNETYTAPACINIKAGTNHAIHALADVVWYCIHATTETDPAKVDTVLIGE